jgi:hypothetical protein
MDFIEQVILDWVFENQNFYFFKKSLKICANCGIELTLTKSERMQAVVKEVKIQTIWCIIKQIFFTGFFMPIKNQKIKESLYERTKIDGVKSFVVGGSFNAFHP